MQIFTRTTKVLGLTTSEAETLQGLITQAKREGKAEAQISPTVVLAVDVDDELYRQRPRVRGGS